MPNLSPCPGCNRHVRTDETACPFCAQALCPSPCDAPAPSAGMRFGRMVLVTAGATLLGVTCTSVQPVYGSVSPPPDAGATSDADSDGTASDK